MQIFSSAELLYFGLSLIHCNYFSTNDIRLKYFIKLHVNGTSVLYALCDVVFKCTQSQCIVLVK